MENSEFLAVLNADGAVVRYGWRTMERCLGELGPGEKIVRLTEGESPIDGCSLEAQTVEDGKFVMRPEEELLAVRKCERRDQIDARTNVLIAEGFEHEGHRFSLSEAAQIRWLGLFVGRAGASYPIKASTIDNGGTHDVRDAAEVASIYATILTSVAAIVTGGAALKEMVNNASTQDELDAVVDAR